MLRVHPTVKCKLGSDKYDPRIAFERSPPPHLLPFPPCRCVPEGARLSQRFTSATLSQSDIPRTNTPTEDAQAQARATNSVANRHAYVQAVFPRCLLLANSQEFWRWARSQKSRPTHGRDTGVAKAGVSRWVSR